MERTDNISLEFSSKMIEEFGKYLLEKEAARATIEKYMRDIHTFVAFHGTDRMILTL